MGSVKRLVLIGSGEITPKQAKILYKHFGDHVIVKHIYVITDADVKRIKPVDNCTGDGEDGEEICADAVVFFKILSKPAGDFLRKGIEVYDFEVAPAPDGKGDLHDGKVMTVGLRRYDLKPKSVARWVYAD
jgi:hypothetical protein